MKLAKQRFLRSNLVSIDCPDYRPLGLVMGRYIVATINLADVPMPNITLTIETKRCLKRMGMR